MDKRLHNRKLMENFTKKLLNKSITEAGGGVNPEADKRVKALIKWFMKEYSTSDKSAARVIVESLQRLGYNTKY